MNISGFADYLREKKSEQFRTDSDVATYLGTNPGHLSNWRRKGKELTNREMAGMFERSRNAAVKDACLVAIEPVVEFFPINAVESRQGMKWELFSTGKNASSLAQELRKKLESVQGIYIFYDSRGRALYVGKTSRRTLWGEMKSAYNRDRGRKELFRVNHPTRPWTH